jgi:hypothetical protein
MLAVLLVILYFGSGCRKSEPVVAGGELKPVDQETGRQIAETLGQLAQEPAEGLTVEDRAAARDPAKVLGRWKIRHTIYKTNGEASEPSDPIVPTVWNFTKDGQLKVEGGNQLQLRYIFTGDKLIVTGFGPKQDYGIVKLTDQDLEVVAKISAGSVRIENTTVLTRAE